MSPLRSFAPVLLAASQLALFGPATTQAQPFDKLTYHNDAARSGWNPHETKLTPAAVASPAFAQLWQTPQFDSRGTNEPRLFATPLYVDQVAISTGPHAGKTLAVIYAASDLGYVYAVNAFASADVPAGAILWSKRRSEEQRVPVTVGTTASAFVRVR
ncbi:MAG: hypothetical protein H7067_19310, partial [Burkholderiales bacterium]|nr:hypothetical protein [Opitutaceae bacterium]